MHTLYIGMLSRVERRISVAGDEARNTSDENIALGLGHEYDSGMAVAVAVTTTLICSKHAASPLNSSVGTVYCDEHSVQPITCFLIITESMILYWIFIQ